MGCGASSDSARPVRPKTTPGLIYSWPRSGQVLLKTAKFRAEYDQYTRELNIRLDDKKLTESWLTWENGQFTLEDVRTYDTLSGETAGGSGIQLQFYVSPDGKFKDMASTQRVLERLAVAQKVHLSLDQVQKATNKLIAEVRQQWARWVELWLTPHGSSGAVQSCGRACVKLVSTKDHNADITGFLAKKFGTQVSNVLMAETSNSVVAVVERLGLRPHTVKTRKYRYVCLDVGGRPVREIWEETSMTIFCWSDVPDLSSAQFLKTEFDTLSKGVGQIVEAMHQRLDYLHQHE